MHQENENGEPVTHLSQEEARAGSRTTVNRNVLGISLLLAVLVLAIVVIGGYMLSNRTGADEVNANSGAVANVQRTAAD